MALKKDAVIEHFNRCTGHGQAHLLHNAACYLVRLILREHEFADIESLVCFCAVPDNLRPWLPTETDRIIFSEGIMEGLREFADPRPEDRPWEREKVRAYVA